jgi:hypothetical protein
MTAERKLSAAAIEVAIRTSPALRPGRRASGLGGSPHDRVAEVSFEQPRSQIGKGGDKLIPVFLTADEQRDNGKELEEWRGKRFKTELVRPFSAVPGLLRRVRDAGLAK